MEQKLFCGVLGSFSHLFLEVDFCGCLFGCELLGFLLGHRFSFLTVFLNLSLETLFVGISLSCFLLSHELSTLFVALSFPGVETTLSLCLVERALADTATEVFHNHNALFGEDGAYCVGRQRAYFYPIQSTVEV